MSKAYPKYKPSGVEWLGDVPEHWETWKLAHGFDLVGSGTTPPTDELEWYEGTIPWITTSELRENVIFSTEKCVSEEAVHKFSALKIFPKGSLAIAMYGATIGRLGILGVEATTNQACCVMHGGQVFAESFVYFWMQAFKESIILLASGGGQPNISQDKIRSLKIPCPSVPEQQAIAVFLDRETGRIDALIAKKERLLELLAEQRTALISRAVTKGLDASAKLKPSGVEWLGDVPEHWEVKRYKNAFTIFQGMAFKSSDYVDVSDVICIRMGNIKKGGSIDLEHNTKYLPDEYAAVFREYILKENDLIIAMTDMSPSLDFLAVPAIITGLDESSVYLLNQRVGKLIINKRFILEYVKYLLLSKELRDQLKAMGLGTVQSNMSSEDLYNAFFASPPLPEQQAIAAFLDRETSKIDALSSKVVSVIEWLKEYRTALISSAVTGKIDVREAV